MCVCVHLYVCVIACVGVCVCVCMCAFVRESSRESVCTAHRVTNLIIAGHIHLSNDRAQIYIRDYIRRNHFTNHSRFGVCVCVQK